MTDGEAALGALVWCPFPDEKSARDAAGALLDERLIACANLLPGVAALVSWQGDRGDATEVGGLFKTVAGRLEAVMRRLADLHPYDSPSITGWTVRADDGTLAWLREETDEA